MTVLLVTGTREGHSALIPTLDRWVAKFGKPERVVLGDAPGVDDLASWWARRRGLEYEVLQASWTVLGRRAGPERNARMVEWAKGCAFSHGTDVHCVAFPLGESKGTRGCMELAKQAGFRVFEVDSHGKPRDV